MVTARFMRKYGFREVGRIEKYMLSDGKLIPAVASTLLRSDFEKYLERVVSESYDSSQ